MTGIEDILRISSGDAFEKAALELFRFQSAGCAPYAEYISRCGVDPAGVSRLTDIPFMPISLFKSHKVYCGPGPEEMIFTSSNTGGTDHSSHYVYSLQEYRATFTAAFREFYGDPSQYTFFCLLPSYLEREGSSLVYMADSLIQAGGGGFYLDDYERLINDMKACSGTKILLGVSYALWDLAERHHPALRDTMVMETGGMKGRREELTKEQFHRILCEGFGVRKIHSEYGMAELMSQAYSEGDGLFRSPPWMKVIVRDLNDPFDLKDFAGISGQKTGAATEMAITAAGITGVSGMTEVSGGINIIDLANRFSCAFIQTQDMGSIYADGTFRISGRIDRSDVRGCNLLVQ